MSSYRLNLCSCQPISRSSNSQILRQGHIKISPDTIKISGQILNQKNFSPFSFQQRIKENQISEGGQQQPKIEENPPLKVPLCAYVEEKVPIEEEPPLNKTENGSLPFNDPELGGCVQCQMEPFEQCSAVPQKSCEFVKDPDCILCPSRSPTSRLPKTRPIAFDITDQNEVDKKTFCNGSAFENRFLSL